MLAGWNVRGMRPASDKVTRAGPVAAQALAGNVKLLRGEWNGHFLSELHGFPDLPHDDQVDALSGAFQLARDLGEGLAAPAQVVSRQKITELLG
jgi:predicted phage terminase large subunit-like protein